MASFAIETEIPEHVLERVEGALEFLNAAVSVETADHRSRLKLCVYVNGAHARGEAVTAIAATTLAAGIELPKISTHELPDVDWVQMGQVGMQPVRAGPFYLHGSHIGAVPRGATVPLCIDSSFAFGTGHHGSTRGCLLALAALADRGETVRNCVDMGCGSGVLSMASASLWPDARVLAVDCDGVAFDIARQNARGNALAGRVRLAWGDGFTTPAVLGQGPYDLVIANILAESLKAMAPRISRLLQPGGTAVLSGILTIHEAPVVARFRAAGIVLERRFQLGEWATLVMRRRGRRAAPLKRRGRRKRCGCSLLGVSD